MAKVKLGNRPTNFKRTIRALLPEGGEGTVEVSFIYRTRKEFAALLDETLQARGIKPPADEGDKLTLLRLNEQGIEADADYILKIADGWNLDMEFGRDTVMQLCDELPGMARALVDDYRAAVAEGRLGN